MSTSETVFDAELQTLVSKDGQVILLRPQTSDCLRLLTDRANSVVSKEEIIDVVWSGGAVSDDSVYQCIAEIRRALSKSSGHKIRTVSKKGYVFEGTFAKSASLLAELPLTIEKPEPINQTISADGTRIAWSASGAGIPVLKTPNWITHLGAERKNTIYGPFYDRVGKFARVVRYDQRGNGMSSWFVPPLTLEDMCNDINAVADAAGLKQFYLFGMSQGVPFAIAYAARYPSRVKGIVGRGGYALGDLAGGNEINKINYEASMKLIELGWDSEDPTYRRYFTSRIAPEATPEMVRDFDQLQKISVPRENLHNFFDFDAHLDVTDEAKSIKCPVLLVHSRGDLMVPFSDGEYLASLLKNCQFVPLAGNNHALVPGTKGFDQGVNAMEEFLRNTENINVQ